MNSNEEVKPLSSSTDEVSPLLDEATVARIRAKELEANARAEAATEVRTEKYRNAKSLKWELRLEELRAVPKSKRTLDEQREFARLAARQLRAKEKGSDVSTLFKIETAEEFWSANRLTADARKIKAWKEQEQIVLDQICWMNEGWECPTPDSCFVSLSDGVDLLDDYIAKHGVIHDDPISYKHQTLKEFLPNWGVWALKDTHDPIWGTVEGFWKNREVFQALCQESEATNVYARYGIRTALPAFHVRMFKARIADHERFTGAGREGHLKYDADKCYRCLFEKLHVTAVRFKELEGT
jgi:hypothetical protein